MDTLTQDAKARANQIEEIAKTRAEETLSAADRQKIVILSHANELFDSAKKEAQDRSVQYYAQAETELKAAQKKSQEVLAEAYEQAQVLQLKTEKELDLLKEVLVHLRNDRHDNETSLTEVRQKLEETHETVKNYKAAISELEKQKQELSVELSRFQQQLSETVIERKTAIIEADRAKQDALRFKEQMEKEGQEAKDLARKEIETFKARENEALTKLKLDEIKKLKEIRSEGDRSLNRHRSEIVGEFLRLTESHMITLLKPELPSSYNWATVNQRLQNEVKASLDEAIYKFTNVENHKGSQELIEQKSQLFIKRFRLVGLSAVAVVILSFAIPPTRSFLLSSLRKNNIDSAAQIFSKEMQTERARRFDPPKTEEWRGNYTDSLLYTRGYGELKLEQKFQDKWIRDLHEYLYTKLRVDEDSIVKLVSLEAAMVTKLKEEADSIHPDYVEQQVKKMREMEKESVTQMEQIIGSTAKFNNFKKFSEDF